MTTSLKSVNTADLKSIGTSDLESPGVVGPQPDLEGMEKILQRVLREVSRSIETGDPGIVLEALTNMQSVIQREIDSLIRKKDEAGTLKTPPSPHEVPEVSEPANALGEEGVPLLASSGGTDQNHDSDKGESDDEESDSTDEYGLEEPVYDEADDIYRCAKLDCGWEVVFGYCHGCHTKYMTGDGESEAVDPTNSLTVFRKGILAPRGDSPPPEAIPSYLRPTNYNYNPRVFDELISRGATLAFCQTWNASFEKDRGIVVRASRNFIWAWGFQEDEDCWEIWIGRRIKLGEDDPEGILFMGDLLDLIFTEDDDGLWITYKDRICWVTRPKEGPEITRMEEVFEAVDVYRWSSQESEESDLEPSGDESSDFLEAESTSNPATSDCESTWWSDDSESEAGSEGGEAEEDVRVGEAMEENKGGPSS